MGKKALYFSHDSNAHRDIKIVRLRRSLGWAGYGLYWALIECLHDTDGHSMALADLPELAYELRADEDQLRQIVEDFGLFEITGGEFHSPSLTRRIEQQQARRAARQAAGRAGGKAKARKSPAWQPPKSEGYTSTQRDADKVLAVITANDRDQIGQHEIRKGYTIGQLLPVLADTAISQGKADLPVQQLRAYLRKLAATWQDNKGTEPTAAAVPKSYQLPKQ